MADQAEKLRDLFRAKQKKMDYEKKGNMRIITVASGKGGVGKTSLTVNLAIALSKAGKKVLVMDADLGMANIDIMMGLTPKYTLYDFLNGQKSFSEIIIQDFEGINIIPGCSGIFEEDNILRKHKESLIKELAYYAQKMDFVLIDTGAGISQVVLGFIAVADDAIIVITPEPTSITDGYGIIKVLSKFKLHKQAYLIVNMANNLQEAQETARRIEMVANRYLDIEIKRLGVIHFDNKVKQSIKEMTPFIVNFPRSQAARDVTCIANNILEHKIGFHIEPNNFAQKLMNLLR